MLLHGVICLPLLIAVSALCVQAEGGAPYNLSLAEETERSVAGNLATTNSSSESPITNEEELDPRHQATFSTLSRHAGILSQRNWNAPAGTLWSRLASIEVKAHFRSSHGRLLPDKGEPITVTAKEKKELQQILDVQREEYLASLKVVEAVPSLPTCKRDTDKTELLISKQPPLPNSVSDILFIEPPLPKDPSYAFGVQTMVVPCERERGRFCTQLAEVLGVTCLPSRIRLAERKRYRYHGKPALLNYDEGEKGEDRLSEKPHSSSIVGG